MQQMSMRAIAPPPHLAPHLAGPGKQPQGLESFPGFPLMGNPPMSAEVYQHQQQQLQHMQQLQMQQFQQIQQEAQRTQQRK